MVAARPSVAPHLFSEGGTVADSGSESATVWPASVMDMTGAVPESTCLNQDAEDDAAILRAAGLRVVRRHRLLFSVADDVDAMQRNLVLLVEVALHGFSALHADLLVERLVADVVRMTFDLEVRALRIGLQLRDDLIDAGFRLVRERRAVELEVARVLAQHDFVDHPANARVERFDLFARAL